MLKVVFTLLCMLLYYNLGGKGGNLDTPSLSRPFLVAPAVPSTTHTTGHHRNSTVFAVFFYLFVLLLGVELLDFVFYITKSPYHRSIQVGAAEPSSNAPDSAPAKGASSSSEDFELVHSTQTGDATMTATIASTGTVAAQSLENFLSPAQLPPADPAERHRAGPTSSGGSSVLSDYLATRRYGRGAVACVVVLLLGAAQVCSEAYWRAYFSSWSRKSRPVQSSGVFGTELGVASGGGSSGLPSRRSRKQVAHTV